ncbi:MAG: hypothetical protein H0T83_04765 [Chthoniobacterales bacterium]|nr:hypothetical protein [Chthoniobacterales bacterium]
MRATLRGGGVAINPRVMLDPARDWVDNIITNIRFELDSIERRRALALTLEAIIVAIVATILTLVSAAFAADDWFRAH